MSKEIKELKQELADLKQKVKRLDNEMEKLYMENNSLLSVIADIKKIKRDLMEYSEGKLYFENAW
tara:strand:- start:1403 stop:1597 length:195 start_codon:yes stop_codon:yes gene_type:complete